MTRALRAVLLALVASAAPVAVEAQILADPIQGTAGNSLHDQVSPVDWDIVCTTCAGFVFSDNTTVYDGGAMAFISNPFGGNTIWAPGVTPPSADYYIKAYLWSYAHDTQQYPTIWGRMTATPGAFPSEPTNGYFLMHNTADGSNAAQNRWALGKRVGGTDTELAFFIAALTDNAITEAELRMVGATITAAVPGEVNELTANDPSITAANVIGFGDYYGANGSSGSNKVHLAKIEAYQVGGASVLCTRAMMGVGC